MKAFCQVSTDTARYYAELDRQARYEAAITERQDELLDELDDLETLDMTQLERVRLMLNFRVILRGTKASHEQALREIREVIQDASWRTAERQYKEEMHADAEALAVERWERLSHRCEEWA